MPNENTTTAGKPKYKGTKYGHLRKNSQSVEYNTWAAMMNRCYRKNDIGYKNYGGRGIAVCARWHSFANFLQDMGDKPHGHTLDRFPDNNGNYEQGNCRWATWEQQGRNRRNCTFSDSKVKKLGVLLRRGVLDYKIAKILGVSFQAVSSVARGNTWKGCLQVPIRILHGNRKLCEKEVEQVKQLNANGIPTSKIWPLFGVSRQTIDRTLRPELR